MSGSEEYWQGILVPCYLVNRSLTRLTTSRIGPVLLYSIQGCESTDLDPAVFSMQIRIQLYKIPVCL